MKMNLRTEPREMAIGAILQTLKQYLDAINAGSEFRSMLLAKEAHAQMKMHRVYTDQYLKMRINYHKGVAFIELIEYDWLSGNTNRVIANTDVGIL